MVCMRYIHTRHGTLDLLYLLAGVGRPMQVPQHPRLRIQPLHQQSWPQLGFVWGPFWLHSTAWKQRVMWLWTAAPLRYMSLGLTGQGAPGQQWLLCHEWLWVLVWPSSNSQVQWPWPAIYMKLELPPASTGGRHVGLHWKSSSARESQAEASSTETQISKLCPLSWANLLHPVWRSCEFLVLLLDSLCNYSRNWIHFSIN
jgi:hypothetical protein